MGQLEFAEEKGRAEGRAEVARRLLAKEQDISFIASVTDLTEAEVMALAEAMPPAYGAKIDSTE